MKIKKVHKQVRGQRNGIQVLLEIKVNPKAFAIPILTAATSANRNLMQSG